MSFVARPDNSPEWAEDLPEGWTSDWVKWSVAFASAKPSGDDIEKLPYISNEDIASWTGRLLKEGLEPTDKEGRLFRRDDLLFNKLRPYLAKVYHADFDGISSGELLNLRTSERVLSRFLFHVLSSFAFIETINAETFGTKMPRADWETIGHQPLPLPDIDTQRRIARYLDDKTARIDALIEKKRTLLDRLAEKRQALITRAVTRGLAPDVPVKDSGSEWLGSIPEHWSVRPLKWRVSVQSGQVDPVADEYKDLPLIAPDHIEQRTGRIIEVKTADEQSAMSGKYLCAPTAVLYSKIRPALRKAVVFGQNCLCSADMYALNPGDEVERDFLLFFLLTEAFSAYAELSSLRVAMPKVNREALGSVEICIPPLDEQGEIARYCNATNEKLLAAIDAVAQSIGRLTEYRTTLVTVAVTGKIKALLTEDVHKPVKEAPAAFKRSVLAAYIADTLCDHPSFGRVKFQKLLHLSEAHLGLDDVSGNYYRDAAGPFDTQMMRSVHSQMAKQGWIIAEKRDSGAGWHYRRGDKVDAYNTYFDRYFGDQKEAIDDLLALFAPMTTQQSEIVSTAFAAWNDLLLEGKFPTDGEIVDLILNDWTESKRQIVPERWHAALGWMREKGLVPRGIGEHMKTKGA